MRNRSMILQSTMKRNSALVFPILMHLPRIKPTPSVTGLAGNLQQVLNLSRGQNSRVFRNFVIGMGVGRYRRNLKRILCTISLLQMYIHKMIAEVKTWKFTGSNRAWPKWILHDTFSKKMLQQRMKSTQEAVRWEISGKFLINQMLRNESIYQIINKRLRFNIVPHMQKPNNKWMLQQWMKSTQEVVRWEISGKFLTNQMLRNGSIYRIINKRLRVNSPSHAETKYEVNTMITLTGTYRKP